MNLKVILAGGAKLYNHTLQPLIATFVLIIRKIKYKKMKVRVLDRTRFDKHCKFDGYNSIGSNSNLHNCHIGLGSYVGANQNWKNVTVGKFCSIGSNTHIITGKHPSSLFVSTHPSFFSKSKNAAGFTFVSEQKFEEQPKTTHNYYVEIGNDVWIGDNVTIMSGCKIADGAIIGANALVTKDVLPYSINVGIPAKKIKCRFSEKEIEFLLHFKWWDKDLAWISNHAELFANINNFIKEI